VQDVSDRLRAIEERLERLLASGWHNAGDEAVSLGEEADAIAGYGLPQFADRLRRVEVAQGGGEALASIAMASSACRLLRARIPADAPPPGDWAPLTAAARSRTTPLDRLMPVARVPLDGAEVWACVRLHGGIGGDMVMIDPPIPETLAAMQPMLAVPTQARDSAAETIAALEPWLKQRFAGRLRWKGRRRLGVAGEVEHCVLEDVVLPAPSQSEKEWNAARDRALSEGALADVIVILGGGLLQAIPLDAASAGEYAWIDPVMRRMFESLVSGRAWAIVWARDAVVVPLALLIPGTRTTRPSLVHLTPGDRIETVL
jgi:hypothetical protein